MQITRTNSQNNDFITLVRELDAFLAVIDGDEHAFYAQFNQTAFLQQVVLAYENGTAIACGAMKPLDDRTVEMKRMYVRQDYRRRGMAARVLSELEEWAAELGYRQAVLETGIRQPEAIALYRREGYARIENYGQYAGVENSVCFAKQLGSHRHITSLP